MRTLIAEDLLLLLLDDEKGTLTASDKVQPLLGGALLLELAMAERLEVAERTSRWSTAKVAVVDGPTPDDPLLVDALAVVAEKPRRAQDLVNRIGKGLKDRLLHRLADRGLVERREGRVLGLFPHTTWPATDARHEQEVRARLHDALVAGLTPDQRTSALVALLAAIDHAHKVVDRGDAPARDVKRRATEIAEGAWAADAVKDAVAAAQAAMTAAVTASVAATTASGS